MFKLVPSTKSTSYFYTDRSSSIPMPLQQDYQNISLYTVCVLGHNFSFFIINTSHHTPLYHCSWSFAFTLSKFASWLSQEAKISKAWFFFIVSFYNLFFIQVRLIIKGKQATLFNSWLYTFSDVELLLIVFCSFEILMIHLSPSALVFHI